MSISACTDPFCLGDAWEVFPAQHLLRHPEREVRVEPKVMDVLCVLADAQGRTVLRQTLLETAWPDVVVEENALSRAISQLRKALDDSARDPQFVATIPKKGYRLVADVRPLAPPKPAAPFPLAPDAEPTPAARSSVPARWGIALGLGLAAIVLGAFALMLGPTNPRPWTRTPLTSFPGMELSPTFSPDGTRLAYVRMAPGFRGLGVFVQGLGDDMPRQLTEPPEGATDNPVAWSPDGATLAYVRTTDSTRTLWQIPVESGYASQVAALPPGPVGLAWAPGNSFVVAAEHDGRTRLVRVGADGTLTPLTTPEATAADRLPVLSPDGRRLVFVRRHAGQDDVFVQNWPDGEARRLTWDAQHVPGLTWAADGKQVLYSSNRDGVYKLWQQPADGGAPVWFVQAQAYDPGAPAFSADGRRLAYADYFFDTDVYRQARGDSSGASVAASTQWDQHVHAVGDRVVFVSNRTGATEVWTARDDGSDLRRVSDLGGTAATPRLARDGAHVAFVASVDGQSDVYHTDLATGAVRRLTDDEAPDTTPVWAADGRAVYVRSSVEGRWQIRRVALDAPTGTPPETLTDGYRLGVLPDGRLVFTRVDVDGLWTLTDDRPTRLLDGLTATSEWTVGPDGVYALARRDGFVEVIRHDLATGTETPVGRVPVFASEDLSPFAVTEEAFYVTAVNRAESDIVWVTRPRR